MFGIPPASPFIPPSPSSTENTHSSTASSPENTASGTAPGESSALPMPAQRGPHPLQIRWRQEHGQSDPVKLAGPESRLDLHKQTTPPIYELKTLEEMSAALQQIQHAMADWKKEQATHRPPKQQKEARARYIEENVDRNDWRDPKRTYRKKWNARLRSTHKVIKLMSEKVERLKKTMQSLPAFAYRIGDEFAGVMMLDPRVRPDKMWIEYLVTHPGSDAAGGSLIEIAAQFSEKCNRDGKLILTYLNGDSREAYKKLGFLIPDPQTPYLMELDPSTSDKWRRDADGQWRLASLLDENNRPKKYIA